MRPFRLFLLTTLLVPALLRAEGVTVRVCEGSCRVFLSPERPALRAVVSTLFGESADSLIFFPIAFGGLLPVDELLKMMAVQALAKTLYEVLVLPVTVRVVRYVKRVDGSDVYDTDVSYNILKLKQL